MKNKELFEKTVNSLVQSYINDTLDAYDCRSCAVGNIVAGTLCIKLINKGGVIEPENFVENDPYTDPGLWNKKKRFFVLVSIRKNAALQISLTGYSEEELFEIESVFMKKWVEYMYDREFNALIAVYELLLEIHEVNEGEVEKAETVFSKSESF